MTAGVYIIRNKTDGKAYVGSATQVQKRLMRHRSDLLRSKHPNQYLQRAFDKHGEDAFSFEVLMLCVAGERLQIEQSYIDHFRSTQEEFGYNLIHTRESQLYGESLSSHQKAGWAKFTKEERREKASHLWTEEAKAKGRDALKIAHAKPEYTEKRRAIGFRTFQRADMRKQNSDRLKAMWRDPVFRAARLEGLTRGRTKTNAARKHVR